jgi:nitroreductase
MSSNYSEALTKLIEARRSVRSFSKKPISTQDIKDLVNAAIYAPSGSNAQNQRFLILTKKSDLNTLGSIRWVWPYITRRSVDQLRLSKPAGIIGGATAAIVVFSDSSLTDRRCNGEYPIWESLEVSNASASIQNILLLATAKGIGSCWLSFNFKMSNSRLMSNQSVCKAFPNYHIPPHLKPQGIVILGYPNRTDNAGFPYGEEYHGTTHQPVRRKPMNHYLIKANTNSLNKAKPYSIIQKTKHKVLTYIVKSASKAIIYFSSKLERLELNMIDIYNAQAK